MQEILNEINTEANKYAELSDLQANTSKVGFWNFVKNVVAFSRYQLELILQQHKQEVADMVKLDYAVGTVEWYKAKALEFQYGDKLIVQNDNTLVYAVVDTSKCIVSKSSVSTGTTGGIVVKVNKGVAGNLQPLTNDEKGAFESYLTKVKMAGTFIAVQSAIANQLTLSAVVQIEKEIFKANGKRLDDDKESIVDGLKQFVNYVGYDEVIYLSDLIKHVQGVDGVRGAFVTGVTIDGVVENISNGKFVLPAGYGVLQSSAIVYELV